MNKAPLHFPPQDIVEIHDGIAFDDNKTSNSNSNSNNNNNTNNNTNNISLSSAMINAHNLSSSRDSQYSYSSSTTAAASSSKAVLAALRALQDKIKRIEGEKTSATDEVAKLQGQIKAMQMENEYANQRESLNSQKASQEMQVILEKLRVDKTDLGVLEEKVKELTATTEEQQKIIGSMEHEKQIILSKQAFLDNQAKSFDIKEKELLHTMMWDKARHESNMKEMSERIISVEEDLAVASKEKVLKDAKIFELNQVLTQALSLNEAMMCQLGLMRRNRTTAARNTSTSPVEPITNFKKVKVKTPTKTSIKENSKVSMSPKVPSVNLSSVRSSFIRNGFINGSSTDNGVEYLIKMHKVYSALAKSINEKSSSITSPRKSRSVNTETESSKSVTSNRSCTPVASSSSPFSSSSSSHNMRLLSAGKGKSPSSNRKVKKDTRLSYKNEEKRSGSIDGRSRSISIEVYNDNNYQENIGSSSFDAPKSGGSNEAISTSYPSHYNSASKALQFDYSNDSSNAAGNNNNNNNNRYSSPFQNNNSKMSSNSNSSSSKSNGNSNSNNQREAIINSLEAEQRSLNQEYRQLLAFNFLKDYDSGASAGIDTSKADQLILVIKKIKSNDEQLKSMKNPVYMAGK